MPAQHYAAPYCLLFKVLGVSRRIAVAVNAATYLHPENFATISD